MSKLNKNKDPFAEREAEKQNKEDVEMAAIQLKNKNLSPDDTLKIAMGEGDVDFDGIFETLRDMDFANKQLRADAPKAGGDNIACVSMFGFPEKMDRQAPEARERIERELLK